MNRRVEALNRGDGRFEAGALLQHGLLLVGPQPGIFGARVQLGETDNRLVVVKDASSGAPATPRSRLPWPALRRASRKLLILPPSRPRGEATSGATSSTRRTPPRTGPSASLGVTVN